MYNSEETRNNSFCTLRSRHLNSGSSLHNRDLSARLITGGVAAGLWMRKFFSFELYLCLQPVVLDLCVCVYLRVCVCVCGVCTCVCRLVSVCMCNFYCSTSSSPICKNKYSTWSCTGEFGV